MLSNIIPYYDAMMSASSKYNKSFGEFGRRLLTISDIEYIYNNYAGKDWRISK